MQSEHLQAAALGGTIIGAAAAVKFLVTGRTLGVSGTVRGGLVKGDLSAWRVSFNAGLLLGGLLAARFLPTAFERLPSSYTLPRAAAGGLFVGVGVSLGNGCTSGHGICGNARLSPRSLAYTLTFIAAAIATATLADSAAAILPASAAVAPTRWDQPPPLDRALGLAASSLLALGTLMQLAHRPRIAQQHQKVVGVVAELAVGVVFGLGLAISGMLRPSKVVAFLSALHPAWDLSLAVVMGTALLVATPAFQAALRRGGGGAKPACAPSFQLPGSERIDARLLVGGVLFGVGWGLSGTCPGPALVSLAVPQAQTVVYLAGMVGGMFLEHAVVA